MKVETHIVTKLYIDIQHLEDVIKKTFGFEYDIYEKEGLLEKANFDYDVAPHKAKFRPFTYVQQLHRIKIGAVPEEHSLHIILNELCERGQLDEGEYFI